MIWRIAVGDRAKHDLAHLDPAEARRVGAAIDRLAQTGEGDVKRLRSIDTDGGSASV